jgi:hypothetical protein
MISLVTASSDESRICRNTFDGPDVLNRLVAHRSVQRSKDNRTDITGIVDLREDRGENTAARRRGKTKIHSGTLLEEAPCFASEVWAVKSFQDAGNSAINA